MKLSENPAIKMELDNLELQFGTKAMLTLDDCAELLGIGRRYASQYVQRYEMPTIKIGGVIYIPTLDFALYLAKRKAKSRGEAISIPAPKDEMKNRRGFRQRTLQKQLEC